MSQRPETNWDLLAPYWEFFENKNLNPAALEPLLSRLSDPVLLVGSGQGFVTRALRQRGFRVVGIDWSWPMVVRGREKRGEDNLVASAIALPFRSGSFGTVIFSTGTIDFMRRPSERDEAISEGRRVRRPGGMIVIAFNHPFDLTFEAVARQIGLLENDIVHGERALQLWQDRHRPFRWLKQIRKWTGKSFLESLRLLRGALPAVRLLVNNLDEVNQPLIAFLAENGESPDPLLALSYTPVPYWTEESIRAALAGAHIPDCEIKEMNRLFLALG